MHTYGKQTFFQSAVRSLVYKSRDGRLRGFPGRVIGRWIGWRLAFGPRMIIDHPREVMQRQMLDRGAYEPNIAYLVYSLLGHGDVFFDVGANAGQHSLIAAYHGACVHAFEPVPRLAQRVRDNAKLNRLTKSITVHEVAAGDRNTIAEFFVADRSDDGSHSLVSGIAARTTTRIDVRVQRLDELVSTGAVPSPHLIKIDVEGGEASVLDGIEELLVSSNAPTLIVEASDELAARIGESAQSVLSRLLKHDYVLYRIPERGNELKQVNASNVESVMANYLAIPARLDPSGVIARLKLPG